jgi:NAD(P)-dependent dehydrogenase (short-subunit alcohol dehydrogenase family)
VGGEGGDGPRGEKLGMDFEGRVAVVTGASCGIGRATGELLAARGAHVALVARSRGRLEEVQSGIRQQGGSATVIPADLTDLAQIEALGARVGESLGGADILVNAAGAWHDSERQFKGPPLEQTPAEQIEQIFAVELRATIHLTRVLLPVMKARGRGKIVNLSCGFAGPHEGKGGCTTTWRTRESRRSRGRWPPRCGRPTSR